MRPATLRSAIIALLALLAGPAWAQDDSQLWLTSSASAQLSETLALSQEVVARFSDNGGGLYEVESNTLLGYRLSRKIAIWAGYTHDPLYTAGRHRVTEHRLRQQLTADDLLHIGLASLSLRMRLEARWRDETAGTGWRLRPFARLSLPLGRSGKTVAILSHESFVNLNLTGFQSQGSEERMRNMVAIRTPLAKGLNLELGYLNQHRFVRGGPDTQDHVASASLAIAL